MKKIGEKTEELIGQMGEIPEWSEDPEGVTLVLRDTNGFVKTAKQGSADAFEEADEHDAAAVGDVREIYPRSVRISMDGTTYKVKLTSKTLQGVVLEESEIDLPMEELVVGAAFNEETRKVELQLKNGNKIAFDVNELIRGLVTEINTASRVYATDTDGEQTALKYSMGVESKTLVQRTSNGDVLVPDVPTSVAGAVNRKYVDSLGFSVVDGMICCTYEGGE